MCYFKAHELVPPSVYKQYGEKSFRFIDEKILNILSFLRDYYKSPILINNYVYSGNLKNRGLRLEGLPFFKKYSCHSFGRAVDINVKGVPSDMLWEAVTGILSDDLKTLGLTAVESKEDTPTWTHLSVSNFKGWDIPEINGIKILKG